MADDNEPTNSTNGTGTTTAPATQSSGPVITPEIQALIDAAAQKAHDAGAAAARRALEGKQKQPDQPKPPPAKADPAPSNGMSAADVARIVSRENAFARAAERHKWNEDQERFARVAFDASSPENVNEWAAALAKVFSPAPAEGAGQTANPNTAQKPPSGATSTSAAPTPAPSSSVQGDGPESIRKYDETMIRAWIRSKGGDVNNMMNPINRPILAEWNRKLEAEMAGFRIVSSKQ